MVESVDGTIHYAVFIKCNYHHLCERCSLHATAGSRQILTASLEEYLCHTASLHQCIGCESDIMAAPSS